MGANKISNNLKKCGEIFLDVNSKNRKNKICIFHCTFCNLDYHQLKKFSLHIVEEHLKDSDDILKESELKFEAESEELQIHAFTDNETTDIKVVENSIVDEISVNPDPLDIVSTVIPALNCEVKHEMQEDSNDESASCDRDCTAYKGDSEKETRENAEISKENNGTIVAGKNSDKVRDDCLDLIPDKRRKRNARSYQNKQEDITNLFSSDESKDADYNMEKDTNAIKKHKPCKKRWKKIDDSKLPILIEMYKKHEILWQVNNTAFGITLKRDETFGNMFEELKSSHNFIENLGELQDYIDYINYIFSSNKEQELTCELDKTEFKPTTKYYKELYFLNDSQGPFKCPNCNEIITKYDRFHIHVAQHNGTIPFKCRLCEMGFQKFNNYLKHMKRHFSINGYHCNVCGKGYPVKSELEWHLTSHTGVKPFLCSICGAGFRARQHYNNHIRRHEKRFRYECHICKRGFNHMFKLNIHIKSHLNIRDIICNVCGKGFTATQYLLKHKVVHDKVKPYECNDCYKSFVTESGLRKHRKRKHIRDSAK